MSYNEEIERGIQLLILCQQLQSEKDGVDRPEPGFIDKSKTLDQFAIDVMHSISMMATLKEMIPIMSELTELGMLLESRGKIKPQLGESYSHYALEWFRHIL